jgi:O-antigen/teichoic acid export membrane protein
MSRWDAGRAIVAMLVGAALAALLGFAAQILLARAFEPEVLGAFAVAVTVSTAATPIALAGIQWFENDRRVLADPARWRPALGWWFRWSLPAGVGLAAIATWLFGYASPVALVAGCLTFAVACIERALARLQGEGRFQAVAWLQPLSYVARLAAVLVAIAWAEIDLLWWAIGITHIAIGLVLVRRFDLMARGRRPLDRQALRAGSAELAPLAGLSILQLVGGQADRLVVAASQPAAITGYYAAAIGFILLAELLPKTAAMRYLLPRLSVLTDIASGADPRSLALRVTGTAIGAGIAVGVVMAVAAPSLILVAYGPRFGESIGFLATLAAMLPARFLRIALEPFFLGTMKRGRAWSEVLLVGTTFAVLAVAMGEGGIAALLAARVVTEWLIAAAMLVVLLWRTPARVPAAR